ncbi:ATP-binding protein [Streptomyces sp. NPDC018352]|uniref:ATP-binding protein n=1 Tax=Streptomyces sp. NPDC018352 TaxID=3157194 RepID=UPI0033F1F8E9
MYVSSFTALCPAVTAETGPQATPCPRLTLRSDPSQAHPRPHLRSKSHSGRGLSLSFTLPGDPRSAFIGRTVVAAALEVHGLASYVWPATHVMDELVAVTVRMSPGKDLYVSLRHREDAVRLLVWDQHPHHAAPDTATLCETRRRRALWMLAAVVDDWGGEWGATEASPPRGGIKSWVRLPR